MSEVEVMMDDAATAAFAPRTVIQPPTTVVRTKPPTDEEIVAVIMAALNNRSCLREMNELGLPSGHMVVPAYQERYVIAHVLLPAVRHLSTGHEVDWFDHSCGSTCGYKENSRG